MKLWRNCNKRVNNTTNLKLKKNGHWKVRKYGDDADSYLEFLRDMKETVIMVKTMFRFTVFIRFNKFKSVLFTLN